MIKISRGGVRDDLLRTSSRIRVREVFIMEKKYARLAALLAAAVLCGNGAPSMAADWWVGDGTKTITITAASKITGDVYGNHDTIDTTTGAVTGHVEMTGGTVNGEIYGGYSNGGAVTGSTVTITGGTVNGDVYGGWSKTDTATGNTVTIGGIACWNVFGGYSNEGAATSNTVTISDGTVTGYVYGGYSNGGAVTGNTVTIGGIASGNVFGGYSDMNAATGNTVTIFDGTVTGYVYGGYSYRGASTISGNTVTITSGSTVENSVYGGYSNGGSATYNTVTITGGEVTGDICGGWGNTDATNNRVTITGGTVTGDVYGGRMENGNASGNTVTISGGTVGTVDSSSSVYGGWSWNGSGEVSGNTVALLGSANVSEASLYGSNKAVTGSGNTLLIDGWSGSTQSVKNFETIRFNHVTWNNGQTILDLTEGADGDLKNTKVDAENLVIHGSTPQVGESMTFIKNEKADTGLSAEQAAGGFTQGVATAGTAKWNMQEDGKILNYTITGVFLNAQTDAVAENRLAGAAFVNQGADIAADSLRLLDDGYHFGTQTFGAVYGNRSTYDVASDIKINGWSEIAGFGNIHEVKGGRLTWGVFYENGTGNYRTWNTFNNEMFRGDGSLLYNGGGAAIRLTKDSGMYYEASLRAGTLSSSMTNAVKDGDGNSYGFDSDSTYWGAHIGAGKLIQRGSGQWDIYGKYFHTDIDGDSFEMGGDRFSFDSVTSDRLRLGARYIADTDKAWSLYCGAAYEYEFSGGSRMKAGQFEAPEQSLQGSTVFGEIGTVWGRKDSPWSMDVNLRGYAGEREGFSGMVQLAYAF